MRRHPYPFSAAPNVAPLNEPPIRDRAWNGLRRYPDILRALELPVPRQKPAGDNRLSRSRLGRGFRRRGGGRDPGCEGRSRQRIVDCSVGALAIVRGELAPGCTDGENGMLSVRRVGGHRRPRAVQERRFCPLDGLLRLSDPPGQRFQSSWKKQSPRCWRATPPADSKSPLTSQPPSNRLPP